MHSTLVRAQNVFGFFTTIVFVLSGLIAFSVLLFPASPTASINVRNVQVVRGRPHYHSQKKEEYAHIRFDLDADLSSLFNWNTKQLFIYVLARWPSPSPSSSSNTGIITSEAVIWDQIIPNQKPLISLQSSSSSSKSSNTPKEDTQRPGILHLRNVKPKYQITDPSGKLAEKGNVTLVLEYNVQPWVGALIWSSPLKSKSAAAAKGAKGREWGVTDMFTFPSLKGAQGNKKVKEGESRKV